MGRIANYKLAAILMKTFLEFASRQYPQSMLVDIDNRQTDSFERLLQSLILPDTCEKGARLVPGRSNPLR